MTLQIVKVPDEELSEVFDVRDGYPGTGAITFHRKHTEGMSREETSSFSRELYAGFLPFITDSKRVKQCAYCGYYWEDDSTKNNRKLCSKVCSDARRAEQKAEERARNPKTVSDKLREIDYYMDELEYPCWMDRKGIDGNEVMSQYYYRNEGSFDEYLADKQLYSDEILGEGNRRGSKYRGYF